MSEKSLLTIERKNVLQLFESNSSLFLVPDYQRPYAWTENECSVLWEDFLSFALPSDNINTFSDEYFLGSIVIFQNDNQQFEIIDGQQRLITLLLILRAFYEVFTKQIEASPDVSYDDKERVSDVRKLIGKCIWKTNEYGKPFRTELKIDSQVATDEHTDELFNILHNGTLEGKYESRYAKNYEFYQDKIKSLLNNYDKSEVSWLDLPNRILNKCILFPIKADGYSTALRIFSTLNDRGKPLSDSDIFKVQMYKAFTLERKKDEFIQSWKNLESLCGKIFSSSKGDTPMDELFNRYMHYERAREGIKDSTQIGLRAFYERGNYKLLREDHERVFKNLITLADFWADVFYQNSDRFSERTLKNLFVLHYAPNAMWTLIVSVYFVHNQDSFDDKKFCSFLERLIAFIWAYTIYNKGSNVNKLRTPVYKEMINILNDREVTFSEYKFKLNELSEAFRRYNFTGQANITRSILAWWAINYKAQEYPNLFEDFDIEHLRKKGSAISPAVYSL